MTNTPVGEKNPTLPLSERWRARTLNDIVGQWEAVRKLREFAGSWSTTPRPPPVRVAVLEGPPGTGKTAAAFALAADMGWGVVEMNASDARNKGALEEVAGRASLTNTFTEDGRYLSSKRGERNLILLDEADALPARSRRAAAKKSPREPGKRGEDPLAEKIHSSTDEGGMAALGRLVETTRQPLVITANDAYPLYRAGALKRENTLQIKFFPVDSSAIRPWLHRIATAERIILTVNTLDVIMERSKGDLRAVLNDLEAMAGLPPGTDPEELLGTRSIESNMFEATRQCLLSGRFMPSSEVMALIDAPPDDIWPWIEENLPKFAETPTGLSEGLDLLARAQFHIARASRWRVWTLWSYANELLTGGVSTIIHQGRPPRAYGAPQANFPRIFSGMRGARELRGSRDAVVSNLAAYVHMSKRRTTDQILPLIRGLYNASRENEELSSLHTFESDLALELGVEIADLTALFDTYPRAVSKPRTRRARKESPQRLDA